MCFAKYVIQNIENLFDFEFVKETLNVLEKDEYLSSSETNYKRLLRMMQICKNELAYPFYFETDSIASKAKKSSISLDKVINSLIENGFKASKTIMNDKGFKTNASSNDIINALYK
ncbi:MAG: hypothetical protein E6L01_07795 [Thaumarchaeota archaeon]|nr:MAG: hypothetical protein E6L01_07795 [Nitrososphaerota archaeon]